MYRHFLNYLENYFFFLFFLIYFLLAHSVNLILGLNGSNIGHTPIQLWYQSNRPIPCFLIRSKSTITRFYSFFPPAFSSPLGPLVSYNTSYQIPAHTSINMGSTTLPQRTARFLHSPPGSCGTTPNSTTKVQGSLEG
jgi:hypothetical protein